jgi:flagellar protein FliS
MTHLADTMELTAAQQRDLERYQSERVLTAPPQVLVLMMLERVVNDLDTALDIEDPIGRSSKIRNAQDIVIELRCSLDLSQGEIAESLDSLYAYVDEQCLDAFANQTRSPLRPARQVMRDILEGWRAIV